MVQSSCGYLETFGARLTKLDTDVLAFLSGVRGNLGLPSIHDEHVVDGNDVNVFNTFALELVVLLNVSGDLRRTGRGEGSRDKNENVLAGQSSKVDLVFKIVDPDFDRRDSIPGLDLGRRDERSEDVVGRVGGGFDDGAHFGRCGCDESRAGSVDLAGTWG